MKVLIAVDDSDCSMAAVESVAYRCWSANTEFMVLSVVEPAIPDYAGWHTSYVPLLSKAQNGLVAECERLVENKVAYLKERLPDNRIAGQVMEGNIRDSIVHKAIEWDADFIVLGSHGRTGFGKFLLGSVAESIVSQAPCSVEIIRSSIRRNQVTDLTLATQAKA